MHRGFIKIWRRVEEWDWYDNPTTAWSFIKMILMANWKDKQWQGVTIQRGSFVSSWTNLSKHLKLTLQSTRTVVDRLKSTGNLTIKSTNKFTIYTIVNYNNYQDISLESTSSLTNQLTINQQTTNKQLTTTKEGKELKEGKNTIGSTEVSQEMVRVYDEDVPKKGRASKPKQPPNPEVRQVLDYFGEVFMRQNGVKCCFAWAKDSVLVRDMLSVYGKEVLCGLVDKYFASNDEFILRGGYSIGVFKGVINKLAVGEKKHMSYAEQELNRVRKERLEREAQNVKL